MEPAVEKSVVRTEIGLEWSTEEAGGLVLRVGVSTLARLGPLSLALSWPPSLFMAWLDTQLVSLSNFQLTQSQQGFAADGFEIGLYLERQQ